LAQVSLEPIKSAFGPCAKRQTNRRRSVGRVWRRVLGSAHH